MRKNPRRLNSAKRQINEQPRSLDEAIAFLHLAVQRNEPAPPATTEFLKLSEDSLRTLQHLLNNRTIVTRQAALTGLIAIDSSEAWTAVRAGVQHELLLERQKKMSRRMNYEDLIVAIVLGPVVAVSAASTGLGGTATALGIPALIGSFELARRYMIWRGPRDSNVLALVGIVSRSGRPGAIDTLTDLLVTRDNELVPAAMDGLTPVLTGLTEQDAFVPYAETVIRLEDAIANCLHSPKREAFVRAAIRSLVVLGDQKTLSVLNGMIWKTHSEPIRDLIRSTINRLKDRLAVGTLLRPAGPQTDDLLRPATPNAYADGDLLRPALSDPTLPSVAYPN